MKTPLVEIQTYEELHDDSLDLTSVTINIQYISDFRAFTTHEDDDLDCENFDLCKCTRLVMQNADSYYIVALTYEEFKALVAEHNAEH